MGVSSKLPGMSLRCFGHPKLPFGDHMATFGEDMEANGAYTSVVPCSDTAVVAQRLRLKGKMLVGSRGGA